MHGPRHNNLAFFLAVAAIDSACHSSCGDAAHGFWTRVTTASGNHVLAKVRSDVSGTHREHVDVVAHQFETRGFPDGIQGELATRIRSREKQGDVSCHT